MNAGVNVEFTPEFKKNLRALVRKYREIRSDIQPIIERIQSGEFVGERVQKTHHVVFKVRVRNSDIAKGKSAGYRLIYTVRGPSSVILVTVYSKMEQADVTPDEIRRILKEYGEPPVIPLVTGNPAAAENAASETVSLSTNPKFLALIERSRAHIASQGGLSSSEMRRRLQIPRMRG